MANLAKALKFHQQQNYVQSLRYSELAATKLKQLKDRRLETVEAISEALSCKFNALQHLDRKREALECIKECYTLWAMNHLRNPGCMRAALGLIQSCIHNKEFEDAELYAREAYFMVVEMTDNFIPSNQQPQFLADVTYWLGRAIQELAQHSAIPPAEKQKAGEEAIPLVRKALELNTQLHGTESAKVAMAMTTLGDVLDYFNNSYDDVEKLRLFHQSNAIYRRVEGSSSRNVAAVEYKLGIVYGKRAKRAHAAKALDRYLANLELALPHYREAARIYRVLNRMDKAEDALRKVAQIEESIRQVGVARVAAAAAATRG